MSGKRIVGIGTANWEIFKKFLIDNDLAYIKEAKKKRMFLNRPNPC